MSVLSHFNVSHKHQPLYPQDTPIEENQSYDNTQNPVKTIYKTPKNTFNCIGCTLLIIIGIIFYPLFIFNFIIENNKEVLFGIFIFTMSMIIFMSIAGLTPCYYIIIIDPVNNIIRNKIKKLCCCFSKTKIYKINEIKKIILDKDIYGSYTTINGAKYNAFKVKFYLKIIKKK